MLLKALFDFTVLKVLKYGIFLSVRKLMSVTGLIYRSNQDYPYVTNHQKREIYNFISMKGKRKK